ncbi:CDP-alcohol phosphatidyltransferase family protein [Patescibacteria group bacterium]
MRTKKTDFNSSIMKKDYYPFFERVFYRPIANFLTPKIALFFRSPTMLNVLGFLIGILGIYMIGFGDYWCRVSGAGILLISYIFDCIDGQLARGFKMENGFGALLDTSLDSIKESLIFFALAWSYYSQTNDYYIFLYLLIVLFAQRMFGRTLPRYQLLFEVGVEKIKNNTLLEFPKLLRPIAFLFSESYRSGTIWVIVFLGVISNQIKLTFVYFIVVIFSLFIFLLIKAYTRSKKNGQKFTA